MKYLNTKETFILYDLKVQRYQYGDHDLYVCYDTHSCITVTQHTIDHVFIDAETSLYFYYKQHQEHHMHIIIH